MTALELIAIFQKCFEDHWGYIWGTAGILWTQARQNALEKTTDSNREMSRKYGSRWIGHMVADCSGMFVYAFKKYGLGMSHISSNIYKSYCTKTKGKLTAELKKTIRPGTAVFTGKTAGNHPHVGLYIGGPDGEVIEAHGTLKGVIKSKLAEDRWTFYGELKNVNYDGTAPAQDPQPEKPKDETTVSLPTIRKGNKNIYVKQLQTMLQKLGYNLGICGVDGDYGTQTEKAVKEFQRDKGLAQDGVCGPKTWAAIQEAINHLNAQPAEERYTVTITGLTKEEANALCKTWKTATSKKE